jgi:hypothetical protein
MRGVRGVGLAVGLASEEQSLRIFPLLDFALLKPRSVGTPLQPSKSSVIPAFKEGFGVSGGVAELVFFTSSPPPLFA